MPAAWDVSGRLVEAPTDCHVVSHAVLFTVSTQTWYEAAPLDAFHAKVNDEV